MHRIRCYKKNKVIMEIECVIRDDEFIKQLKDGVIFYDTGLDSGNFEIIYLNNFDKIEVLNELHYIDLMHKEGEE